MGRRAFLLVAGLTFSLIAAASWGQAADCPSGLVSWWQGEGDGSDAIGPNHAQLMNGVSFAPGRVGQAFSFDGLNDYLFVPSNPATNWLNVPWTVELWILPNGPANPGPRPNCTNDDYEIFTNGGIGPLLIHDSTCTWGLLDGSSPGGVLASFNTWTHVAAVFDGSVGTLYLDGAPVETSGVVNLAGDIYISSRDGGQEFFNGLMDEIAIYNRALTDSEVLAIFNAGSAGKCKTLTVGIDIKPGSDPNCFNVNGHGVIPVAILGSAELDVNDIDPFSLSFDGLEVRIRGQRGPLCSSEDSNGDGITDLVCHFEDDASYWGEGDAIGTVTGQLFDGTEFEGSDSICIVP